MAFAAAALLTAVVATSCIKGNIDEIYVVDYGDGTYSLRGHGWLFDTQGREVDSLKIRLLPNGGGPEWFDLPAPGVARPDVREVHGIGANPGFEIDLALPYSPRCTDVEVFAVVDGELFGIGQTIRADDMRDPSGHPILGEVLPNGTFAAYGCTADGRIAWF